EGSGKRRVGGEGGACRGAGPALEREGGVASARVGSCAGKAFGGRSDAGEPLLEIMDQRAGLVQVPDDLDGALVNLRPQLPELLVQAAQRRRSASWGGGRVAAHVDAESGQQVGCAPQRDRRVP